MFFFCIDIYHSLVWNFLIQPANLSKYYGLRFVTSSAEKTELALKAQVSGETKPKEEDEEEEETEDRMISASDAYEVVASAASYFQSRTTNILPFTDEEELLSSSSLTTSVTCVVAAEEDVKQAVADDLKSTISSPCDWFICDDDQTLTRFFVIQVIKQKQKRFKSS